ncbi:MAG TPA: imidazoleglycerol-phosphate dehydratase HisB [Polyangia bacterium]|nr:imidazoleglycerol-phosphate dehydratase HisB [Polyangia bacterium]
MRRATVERNTSESQIKVTLDLDGTGARTIETQVPFFTHMLDAFARHGLFDLELTARGDVEVDAHHVVEDVGLVLGDAFAQALGDKRGIRRYGECTVPMDETLAQAVVDFSGRPHLVWLVDGIAGKWVGGFDAELAHEFFQAFVNRCQCNLHLRLHYGQNAHHILEALWKAFARAAMDASRVDPRVGGVVPSTKGTLTQ